MGGGNRGRGRQSESSRGRGRAGGRGSKAAAAVAEPEASAESNLPPKPVFSPAPSGRSGCQLCGMRDGGAKYLVSAAEDGSSSLICKPCAEFYERCMAHIPLEEVIRRKTEKEPEHRSFRPQSVTQNMGKTVCIERKAVIMNKTEFASEFGFQPLVKHTKFLKTLRLMGQGGEYEDVFVFRWEPTHLRTATFAQYFTVGSSSVLLSEGDHLYQSQAGEAADAYFDNLEGRFNLSNLEEKLQPLSSMRDKGDKASGKSQGDGGAATAAARQARPSPQKHCDDEVDGEEGADDEERAGDTSAEMAWATASTAKGSNNLAVLKRGLSGIIKRSSTPQPAKTPKTEGGDSDEEGLSPRTAAPSCRQGARSEAAGSVMSAGSGTKSTARGMLADPDAEVQKWLERLSLVSVMTEARGVQKQHAENAEEKLRQKGHTNQARRLHEHLQLVALAEMLRADRVMLIDDSECTAAIRQLKTKVNPFPATVQVNLLTRQAQVKSKPPYHSAQVTDLIDLTWPWLKAGEKANAFDPFRPQARMLEVSIDEKVEILSVLFWKGFVTQLMAEGMETVMLVAEMTSHLQGMAYVLVQGRADIGMIEAKCMCELLSATQVLKMLVYPEKLILDADMDERLSEITAVSEAAHGEDSAITQPLALAMIDANPYAANLDMIAQQRPALRELYPLVAEHRLVLESLDYDKPGECCALLRDLVQNSPKILHGLGSELKGGGYENLVLDAIQTTVTNIKAKENVDKAILREATAMVAEANNSWPMRGEMHQWAGELGSALAEATQKNAMDSFMKASASATSPEKVMSNLDTVESAVRSLADSPMVERIVASAVKRFEVLVDASWTAAGDEQKEKRVFDTVETLARELEACPGADVRKAKPLFEASKLFRSVRLVHIALKREVMVNGDIVDENITGETSQKLYAFYAQALEMKAKAESLPDGEHKTEVAAKFDLYVAFLQKIGKHIMGKTISKGESSARLFRDIVGGITGGGNWLDGIPTQQHSKWEKVYELGLQSIMKEPGVAKMKPNFIAVEKATTELQECVQKFGLSDPPEMQEWRDVCKRARVSFVSGLLLHAFKTATDKAALRLAVQKHLAQLQPSATEADLNKAIAKRATQAIAFSVAVGKTIGA